MYIPRDQIDLLSAFNEHGVEYVVVGAHAVNAYTQPRSTKDIDILIRNDEPNAARVFKALAAFGAPLSGYSSAIFCGQPQSCFQIGVEPDRIDILQSIEGVDFESAWQSAQSASIADVPVRILSREHLIANKLAVGRPRDLGDVDELRKFGEEQSK
jgi:predicted nucleotidyltransferase